MYLKGIERWLADLLQPTFDGLVAARSVPRFVQRLRIVEFTLDHQAPVFSDMRRRTSRKARRCHRPERPAARQLAGRWQQSTWQCSSKACAKAWQHCVMR